MVSRAVRCKRGHRFTPSNTAIRNRPDGTTQRRCRTCERDYDRRRWAENRDGRRQKERKLRDARKARRPALAPGDPRHGTGNGYRHHACRCAPCCEAGRADSRAGYARRKRRAENAALAAIPERRGEATWSLDAIAAARGDVGLASEWDDPVAELALAMVG